MIKKIIEDMKINFNVLMSEKVVNKEIALQALVLYTPYRKDSVKGQFIILHGYPYIKWEDSKELFDILEAHKNFDRFENITLHWNTAPLLSELSEELLDLQTHDNEESIKLLLKIMKSVKKLNKIAKNHKDNILSPSEILDLMKANTKYPDLTGRVEGDIIYFYLQDPGDWEQAEWSSHEEEQVLTQKSIKEIEDFFTNLSPQIFDIEIGIDYHLADVSCSLRVKF